MARKKTRKGQTANSNDRTRKDEPLHTGRFLLLAFLLPILALAVIEASLRLTGIGNDLALFIPAPPGFADQELLRVNPDVARRYFTQDQFVPRPLRDFFAVRKPANGFRIFVMGATVLAPIAAIDNLSPRVFILPDN